MWQRYGAAKQANILFAAEAARRWPDIMSASYHPGFVRSRFGAGIGINLIDEGDAVREDPGAGRGHAGLAGRDAPAAAASGGYYEKRKLIRPNAQTEDAQLAAQLWDASMAAVGF